eukprot:Em0017g606a
MIKARAMFKAKKLGLGADKFHASNGWKHTRDPVAILVDGFSGHNEKVNDLLGQVTVPPNITSVYQLLDQGIIATLKTGYKSRLLEKVVASVANYNELQVMAKQLPAGSAGLQYDVLLM